MINILVIGKIKDVMGLTMVDPDMANWWATKGQKQYPHFHLVTPEDLDEDRSLERVDYELSWCWPEDEPRCFFANITQHSNQQIIYSKLKVVYGSWGKPWLTAFKRAIRFLNEWENRKVKVEMPHAVPGYRVQGSISETVN